jgi:hypothetical protein
MGRVRRKRTSEGDARSGKGVAGRGETSLLNVDLDVWSRSPLAPLIEAAGPAVFVLHAGREGRRHAAHFELAASGGSNDVDRLIRCFVAWVKQLPRSARGAWNHAEVRAFDVGIQAGNRPLGSSWEIKTETLDDIASINARLVVTIYGAELGSPPARSGPKRT